jgi:GT2 family glycosyltransferase
MDVSVLTVTWNSAEHIGAQIESVRKAAEGVSFEHLIADNGSSDGTVAYVRQKFPDLYLQAYKSNRGFGAANNELAKVSKGEYILLLNPDMVMEQGSLSKLLQFAKQHPKAAIVSCKLIKEDGTFNRRTAPRRFPSIVNQLVIVCKLHHFFPELLHKYLWSDFDESKEQTTPSTQGSFLLVRRDFYEALGHLFDPRYFIWFEDVDLCREAWARGFEVWYTPIVSCVDIGGKSFAKQKFLWKQKQLLKSMLSYFLKWEPWYAWMPIAAVAPFVLLGAYIHDQFFEYEA